MKLQTEIIAQINTLISTLVDEHTHDTVRQQLLDIIAHASGFKYGILAEMQPDGNHMQVKAIYDENNLKPVVEKILGYSLVGYQFEIDAEYQLSTPPVEIFSHISDFHNLIPPLVGAAVDKVLGVKKIISIRQHTGDQYLGTATFVSTSTDSDMELLAYLCNNHLVYALRLIAEQRERAKIREAYTSDLEERVKERTSELEIALRQAYAGEEKISELYMNLDQIYQVAESRLRENENLLDGLHALENAHGIQEIFECLLLAFKKILDYEDAFIISEIQSDTPKIIATTNARYQNFTYHEKAFFKKVLSSKPRAVFDTSLIYEWLVQSSEIRENAISALHIPLITQKTNALLICIHHQRGFFTRNHIEMAERFSVLAVEAVIKAELYQALQLEKERLEQTVSVRTAELVNLNKELMRENTERRQAEKTAHENEKRYRSLFDSTNDAVFFISLDNIQVSANQQAADMLGYPLNELIGMPIEKVVASKEYEDAKEVKKLLLSGHKVPVYQRIFCKKDGSEFPVEINIALIKDSNDEPQYVQSIVRDISARKQTEEQIRLQASALSAAANGISITDRNGSIVWVNPAFTNMTGYSLQEVFGKNHSILKSNRQSQEFYKNLWETINRGENWYGVIKNRRKDGSLYDEELTITPVFNPNNEITHYVAIKQDISERKKAEREIKNLAKFPEENPDPVLRIESSGKILYANPGSKSLLRAWDVSVGDHLPSHVYNSYLNHPDLGKTKIKIEYPVGDEVFQLSFATIEGTDYIYVYGQNISEAKHAEQMKAEFIASVSHELRTPLAAILGYTEILLEEDAGELNEIQTEFLQIIGESGKHLHILVNDLLDVTKMEAGRFNMQFSSVRLQSVVEKTLNHIRPIAKEKRIQLVTEITETLPNINADASRLEQVLINLLSNAVKFTPEGGEITLITHLQKPNQICVQIKDTGIGIPEEELPKLFNRFYRAKNVLGANIEGTGLGLYISKAIIEGHQGEIKVTSEIGKGSCFEIFLPIE